MPILFLVLDSQKMSNNKLIMVPRLFYIFFVPVLCAFLFNVPFSCSHTPSKRIEDSTTNDAFNSLPEEMSERQALEPFLLHSSKEIVLLGNTFGRQTICLSTVTAALFLPMTPSCSITCAVSNRTL